MSNRSEPNLQELAESRRRFLAGLDPLRARLHRYCLRLLASPLDAEDVVQEVLAQAFFKGPILDRPERFENWAFRVAYNRSMDFLRRRLVRQRPLPEPAQTTTPPIDRIAAREATDEAFGHLVRYLSPKERASLVFKEMLDYSLSETATQLGTSVGAVKAALHRARTKLQAATAEIRGDEPTPGEQPTERQADEKHLQLVTAYAARFNARDWEGLAALLKADAHLEVLEMFDGSGTSGFEQRYFHNYSRLRVDWHAQAAVLAGEPVVLIERLLDGAPHLYSVVRVGFADGRIAHVRDYLHVPGYLLEVVAAALGRDSPAGFEWAHIDPNG
jgi:RNA polymerase sigma-70 factor (ECF subfamily)